MVQPPTDVVPQVDGVPLKPGFAMCFVDKVMPGFEGILLFNTCVDADVQSLGQAKLRYVQWPKKEISLLSALPSTSTASRQMASSEGLRSTQLLLDIAAKQPSREQAVEDTTVAQSCEATPTPPIDGNSPTALVVNNTTNLVEATPTPPTPQPPPQPQQAYLPPPPQSSQEAQLPSLPPQPQQAHLPPPPQLLWTRRGTTPVRAKDHAKMAPINRTPMKPKTIKNKKNTAPIDSDQYLDDEEFNKKYNAEVQSGPKYVHGQPLLTRDGLQRSGLACQQLHEKYLLYCEENEDMINFSIRKEDFYGVQDGVRLCWEFSEMFQVFNLNTVDGTFMRLFTLYVPYKYFSHFNSFLLFSTC